MAVVVTNLEWAAFPFVMSLEEGFGKSMCSS